MTVRPNFPQMAETTTTGLSFAELRPSILQTAQEHSLSVVENTNDHVRIETLYGVIDFTSGECGTHIKISATKTDWLYILKDGLVEHLTEIFPNATKALNWSDHPQAETHPPNFHFTTVQSITPVGTCFMRVRIKATDWSSFRDESIHFRVVLPPEGLQNVEWPTYSKNGSTVWPKGDKTLHRPVYTARWVDHDNHLMDFDIFIHEGGRVTNWVQHAAVGDQLAIVGPNGGGIPKSKRILLFADETALPAATRILETLPDDTTGHAVLQAEHGAECAYAITAPTGVSIRWADRQTDPSLSDLALSLFADHPSHFVWFAGEKSDVRRVRPVVRSEESDPTNSYIAAYWSKL